MCQLVSNAVSASTALEIEAIAEQALSTLSFHPLESHMQDEVRWAMR